MLATQYHSASTTTSATAALRPSPRHAVPCVPREALEVLEQIGKGSAYTVYRARHRASGQVVALKETLYKSAVSNEVTMLTRLSHPHLPHLLGYYEDPWSGGVVVELIEGHTLAHALAETPQRRLPCAEVYQVGWQVSQALAYLHGRTRPVIHRDVKAENLLRTRAGKLYIIDFDIAVWAGRASYDEAGTRVYCSPEQARGKAEPGSDIYSLGVTLWELACGTRPQPEQASFPDLPAECPVAFEALLRWMLTLDPSRRPSAALCGAFFRELTATAA